MQKKQILQIAHLFIPRNISLLAIDAEDHRSTDGRDEIANRIRKLDAVAFTSSSSLGCRVCLSQLDLIKRHLPAN